MPQQNIPLQPGMSAEKGFRSAAWTLHLPLRRLQLDPHTHPVVPLPVTPCPVVPPCPVQSGTSAPAWTATSGSTACSALPSTPPRRRCWPPSTGWRPSGAASRARPSSQVFVCLLCSTLPPAPCPPRLSAVALLAAATRGPTLSQPASQPGSHNLPACVSPTPCCSRPPGRLRLVLPHLPAPEAGLQPPPPLHVLDPNHRLHRAAEHHPPPPHVLYEPLRRAGLPHAGNL